MDKAITTAFMIIVSIVVSVMVFNTVYPAVVQGSESLVNMSGRMDNRLKSGIEIVHIAAELDSNGVWQDSNGDGNFDVNVWVKNTGSLRIPAVGASDVFFGPEGNFTRIPHVDQAGGTYPNWEWTVENDDAWDPTATARININYGSALTSGRYFVKIVITNGLADDDYIGL